MTQSQRDELYQALLGDAAKYAEGDALKLLEKCAAEDLAAIEPIINRIIAAELREVTKPFDGATELELRSFKVRQWANLRIAELEKNT